MRYAHTGAEVRAAEEPELARLPEGTLMQRAASGLTRAVVRAIGGRVYGSRVVLLVGAGNNGADALWAGVRLASRGARVDAVLATGPPPPDSAAAGALARLTAVGGRWAAADGGEAQRLVEHADVVIDGMLGIGGRGALRSPMDRLAGWAADSSAMVVSVDVPSGVDADTGAVTGPAVRADVTVTFGTLKPGLLVWPGTTYAGRLELVDIGLGERMPPARTEVLEDADVTGLLPKPPADSSKYSRGVVGVVAGSEAYPGAAVLATGGAIRAGAGMVRVAAVAPVADRVRARWPEAVVTTVDAGRSGTVRDPDAVLAAGRVHAWVVGPGLGTDDDVAAVVAALLRTDLPVLLDADALTVVAARPGLLRARPVGAATLLTPHAGEFERLVGAQAARAVSEPATADRAGAARRAAAGLGACVLLKGWATVVAAPDGRVRITPTGTPLLATAGSGDVLSGACGALLAGGLDGLDAGSVGAYLHGRVGEVAAAPDGGPQAPISAGDLLASWSEAVRRTLRATR